MNQIFVRSPTNLTISPVSDNPVAGESFNVSGTLLSSNGTGIMDRSGASLAAFLTFRIDGTDSGFQTSGGVVNPNGTWNSVITLGLSFPRGTHNITASFTPTVNYYGSSSDSGIFDSRGYSLISILDPADLDPDRRVVRGNDVSVNISLIDNAGQLVDNAPIDILVDGTFIQSVITDAGGRATFVIPVDSQRIQGPMLISAEFAGINGSTGLQGDATWSRVIVLAPTVIEFNELFGSMVAGENMVIGKDYKKFEWGPSYSITHFEYPIISFGHPTEGEKFLEKKYSENEWRRLAFKHGRLIGGVLIGDVSVSYTHLTLPTNREV